jgi:hypothetical protein
VIVRPPARISGRCAPASRLNAFSTVSSATVARQLSGAPWTLGSGVVTGAVRI